MHTTETLERGRSDDWRATKVKNTMIWIVASIVVLILLAGAFLVRQWLQGWSKGNATRQAQACFAPQRAQLETLFLEAARASGKPRGLRWKTCEWESDVLFARERRTGQLTALVGVTIQFEAIEGGDMEGVAAVGNLRNATGVFFFDRGQWRTIGRAVFNFNPKEALDHFQGLYELVPVAESG
jgi:hypothetical protein